MEKQIDIKRLKKVSELIEREFFNSANKHDIEFNSTHEGYAVILEELNELWDEIKRDNFHNILSEAIQVAAMGLKFVYSLEFIMEKHNEKNL